jgi:hypothetical protein
MALLHYFGPSENGKLHSPMKCPRDFRRATRLQGYKEHFWQELDEEVLRRDYGSLDPAKLREIAPTWDLSPVGRFENDNEFEEYLEGSTLFFCSSTALRRLLLNSHLYELKCFRSADGVLDHLCRVIGHWKKGKALAPVVLEQTGENQLDKLDGYHRLVVAFASGAGEIPFYAKLAQLPPGVREVAEPE